MIVAYQKTIENSLQNASATALKITTMLRWLVIVHVLGATVWVGGHIILATRYLPKALKDKDIVQLLNFEQQYEVLGIPALVIQVITGIWMAFIYQIQWFSFETVHYAIISVKLILLLITVLLALHSRLFIIPTLSPKKLPLLASHIILVTVIAVIMLYLGLSFRLGIT